ncbi:cytochrome c oxidase assembly protein [Amycolatopsis sp. NPDC051373]|uniref:cytochrome c oxidase assembly protein n=1 Tax=Amycolatopsis sp. NPDC051373 TaxID=3155801 RepID=UPI0034505338
MPAGRVDADGLNMGVFLAHGGHGEGLFTGWLAVVPALVVLAGYTAGTWRVRRRGDRWPAAREAAFSLGAMTAAAAVLVPETSGFTGHMLQHVLLGMVAPVLLVLGRPVTLLLRVTSATIRRRLARVLGSGPVGALLFPPFTAALEAGSLWLLYRTGLYAAAADPVLHGVVHIHAFLTGLLFTAAVCQLEPVRHRSGLGVRAGALVGAAAAHAVLAKTLYTVSPPGALLATADRQAGAQLMYYGGDMVELGLALILALPWYAARGRAEARARRRTDAVRGR